MRNAHKYLFCPKIEKSVYLRKCIFARKKKMHLKQLKLSNFKNCESAVLDFSPKINCFVGSNGAGKTNILDAVYYLSFCKSYFNLSDTQNIKHEEDFFAIHGHYERDDQKESLVQCIQKKGQPKQFKLNKKEYQRLADHIGLFPLVMISPYDRDLINDGSEIRRKYIDSVISQFDKDYLEKLIRYNKSLQQRNILLKYFADNQSYNASAIEPWDMQLAVLGKDIYERRKDFLTDFSSVFQEYYRFISQGNEKVSIDYISQLANEDPEVLLQKNIERDRMLKYTTTGTHRDDLAFKIDGYPIKKFGSQGQQKSFVIAIKLAQFKYTTNIKKTRPIMLFDDIFDKLDDQRVDQIIELVSDNGFGQIFITDTQKERVERIFIHHKVAHNIYQVKNGEIQAEIQSLSKQS